MAKDRIEEQSNPELLVTREEAKNLLTDRINKGKKLLDAIIQSPPALEAEKNKYSNWSKYNSQLISNIFSTTKIEEEYHSKIRFVLISPSSFTEEIRDYFYDIKEKNNILESIVERIELFNESKQITKSIDMNNSNTKDNKKVFIIHGHDENSLTELEKIIRDDFKLTPIILKDHPDCGATTIIEKFELYAPQCIFAIALFTPDDQVENSDKKYLQARPNVIYELGWFCAKLSRKKVILILKEGTDVFSDFQGIIQKKYKVRVEELYRELHKELKASELVP